MLATGLVGVIPEQTLLLAGSDCTGDSTAIEVGLAGEELSADSEAVFMEQLAAFIPGLVTSVLVAGHSFLVLAVLDSQLGVSGLEGYEVPVGDFVRAECGFEYLTVCERGPAAEVPSASVDFKGAQVLEGDGCLAAL